MTFAVSKEAPPVSLRERVESLEVGDCLVASDVKPAVMRTTVGRVKASWPDRKFKTAVRDGVIRVWRL